MTAAEFFQKKELTKLMAALAEANGRATARTLSADECAEYIAKFEERTGISKKAMTGTVVIVHGSMEQLPQAYRYRAYSTKASFQYDGRSRTWRFLNAERSTLRQRSSWVHIIASFSLTAKDATAAKYEEC